MRAGPERLTSPRWTARHALTIGLVAAVLALGWCRFNRAANGNSLSPGYVFEWPVFAAFVTSIWVHEMRRARRGKTAGTTEPPIPTTPVPAPPVRRPMVARLAADHPAYDDSDDAALAAYHAYLQWLTDYPGATASAYRIKGN